MSRTFRTKCSVSRRSCIVIQEPQKSQETEGIVISHQFSAVRTEKNEDRALNH